MLIIIELIKIVADHLKEMQSEIIQLNRKTGLLDLKNVRQDGELRFLKTLLSNIVNGKQNGDEIVNMEMKKRPARLLPIRLLRSVQYRTHIIPSVIFMDKI